jgi:hypothetical protein
VRQKKTGKVEFAEKQEEIPFEIPEKKDTKKRTKSTQSKSRGAATDLITIPNV